MMRIHRTVLWTIILMAGFVFSGCGGGSTSSGGGDALPKTEHKADQNQMNPSEGKTSAGWNSTWALDEAPANFNYGQIDNTANGAWVLQAVMPVLYLFDAAGNAKYNPAYLMGEPKLTTSPKTGHHVPN